MDWCIKHVILVFKLVTLNFCVLIKKTWQLHCDWLQLFFRNIYMEHMGISIVKFKSLPSLAGSLLSVFSFNDNFFVSHLIRSPKMAKAGCFLMRKTCMKIPHPNYWKKRTSYLIWFPNNRLYPPSSYSLPTFYDTLWMICPNLLSFIQIWTGWNSTQMDS